VGSKSPACGSRAEKQGYDFVIASAPNVNRLTIGELALVAEERRDISIRTKLAMAKARGVTLGRPENLSRQDVGSVRGNGGANSECRCACRRSVAGDR
jgi:hypothetical protein